MSDNMGPPAAPRRGSSSSRGGRGRPPDQNRRGEDRQPTFRANRGGRGRDKGRGFTNHNRTTSSTQSPGVNGGSTNEHLHSGNTSQPDLQYDGASATHMAQSDDSEVAVAEIADGDVCFICASPIEHISIAPCNHQTCHICSLRLRALYKTRACAHCRTEADFVTFTDDASKRYEEFIDSDFVKIDENLGVKYEKDIIHEDTILLLRYNCPDKYCDAACFGWPDLHRHVKSKHGKVMCDLCTRNKKVFTHEHELFTFGELRKHEKFGDDNPGAVDQSGFRGHPECGFCRRRFYGDDELYTHCREEHEKCHICERRNGGRNPQYYLNYEMLEKHFQEAHFVCLDAECQANKTNVYESEMDLKAHQLSQHPQGLSKDARRDARLVDISSFDYRTPYQPQRQGGRDGQGVGRGRDPNSEPLPVSSAQPLGRAELAYQRQMAIQSSQPATGRQFGGQLSRPTAPAINRPTAATATQPLPAFDSLNLDSQPQLPSTPQDQARQLRHAAVMDRASTLLKNDNSKLSTFRTQVSSYRSSTISASDLIDAFFSLFDAPSSELGKLVHELADIYENDTRRTQLLEAWNSWRAINEDYPSLPGPAGILPGRSSAAPTTNPSGRRVLRLKSSTAQSSRSAVSRHGSWGAASSLSSGPSSQPFPALPNSTATKNGQKRPAWAVSTGAATAARLSSANTRPASSRPPAAMGPKANEEMFPSLPAAAKPSILMAGLTRGSVQWVDKRQQAPVVNAWGGTREARSEPVTDGETADAGVGGKKRGKKGKGQVLYHFG